jgi:hypothetical protein
MNTARTALYIGVGGDMTLDRNTYRYINLVGSMVQPLIFPSPSRCFAIIFWLSRSTLFCAYFWNLLGTCSSVHLMHICTDLSKIDIDLASLRTLRHPTTGKYCPSAHLLGGQAHATANTSLSDSYHIFTAYHSSTSLDTKKVMAEELSGISTMRGSAAH